MKIENIKDLVLSMEEFCDYQEYTPDYQEYSDKTFIVRIVTIKNDVNTKSDEYFTAKCTVERAIGNLSSSSGTTIFAKHMLIKPIHPITYKDFVGTNGALLQLEKQEQWVKKLLKTAENNNNIDEITDAKRALVEIRKAQKTECEYFGVLFDKPAHF